MDDRARAEAPASEQDRRITEVVERSRPRLWRFILRRVADARDGEDLLQDVLDEWVEANRVQIAIGHVTHPRFQVACHRIVDLYRRRRPTRLADPALAAGGR